LNLSLYKIIRVCLKLFKLRFWEIRPEALEALVQTFLEALNKRRFLGAFWPDDLL
jgi:hypothetical protein